LNLDLLASFRPGTIQLSRGKQALDAYDDTPRSIDEAELSQELREWLRQRIRDAYSVWEGVIKRDCQSSVPLEWIRRSAKRRQLSGNP
jgi:hypothetical protein